MFAAVKKAVLPSGLLLLVLIALLFGPSCANIVPPAGGPRDSLPPRLVSATPRDSTRNFRSSRIDLVFDEYVDLQDVSNNLLFTPLFEANPEVQVKGRTVSVLFGKRGGDTLSANTTYILNFGNAIRDFNEGNILKNFTYTFSTGPALDSLELRGRVILAQTGGVDTNMIVVLHRNLTDSAVINQRPQYVTRLDQNGAFRFRNLPQGRFAIYALGATAGSRQYQNKTQLFAFADSAVTTGLRESALTLYAYREAPPPGSVGFNLPKGPTATNRLVFTTNLNNSSQPLETDLQLSFGSPLARFDSARVQLTYDSSFQRQAFRAQLDSTRRLLTLKTDWKEGRSYHLILDRDFAADTSGRRLLKSDTLFFQTKKESDYGKVVIRLKSADLKRNPVLLFVQNDQVVFSAPAKNGVFSSNRFTPGDYELRILYDANDNGQWDPGVFFGGRKRQPELVQPLGQRVTIKPAWENEFER